MELMVMQRQLSLLRQQSMAEHQSREAQHAQVRASGSSLIAAHDQQLDITQQLSASNVLPSRKPLRTGFPISTHPRVVTLLWLVCWSGLHQQRLMPCSAQPYPHQQEAAHEDAHAGARKAHI